MKEKNLCEVLEKCSKAELIKVVLKALELTYASFPWMEIIAGIRLNEIEAKIDANIAESCRLNEKLKAIPEERRVVSDDEARNIMIAIHDNNKEYFKLQKRYNKIFHELYG